MRTFLTPGLVLILQAGSVALAGFLPSTLLDVFRPEGQQIRLNVQSFDLNHDPVYRPVDDADAGKVSAPSATARARTEKRSGHAAPPGTAFDIRRDGDEFRLVYRLDAAAEIEVAVFDVAGRLTDCQSGGAAIGLAGTPSISPQAAPNPGAPGRRSHPSLRDLGTRRPGGTAQPPARPVRSKAAAAAHRGRP